MKELKVMEIKGQRIITTKLLAEKYGCKEIQIQQNFKNHSDKFEEGKHFYLLQGEELKDFKRNLDTIEVAQNVNKLYLWTERGILRHAKILDTERAWDMYEELEETYFKVQNNQLQLNNDISKQIAEIVQAEVQTEIQKINSTCSQYYKPTATDKFNASKYIKTRLGIVKANDEYEAVKQRIFFILGVKTWESIPIEVLKSSLNIIDESIRVIKADRPQQISFM